MNYIVEPRIREPGTGKAAGANESPQERLLKYVPLSIAGAYPLLENGIAEYIKTPIGGISPREIAWFVFAALLLWYVLFLNQKFSKTVYRGRTRFRLQGVQTVVSIIAFCVWSYSIKSAIWSDIYNAGLALISTVLFVLFASLYSPTVTPEEAKGH